ncbi:MAG: Ni/Fe hydrogenase subunit alpha [Burkholderiales bacterium]|nr:Ni/Fe hydrogenase subunit alpha [Burkholderiales bacterium]
MAAPLETASDPERLRRVAIEPVTRVEGHGKVTLLLDEANRVRQARFHIVEFRGFEKFVQGRPYWEVPVMVQRLCGICPVSHHLAGGKAVDMLAGATALTPTAEKMRRLLHFGQILQSHALHFFHLSSPDLLFGFDAPVERRSVFAVAAEFPDIAKKGILLRKYGQEVIRVTAGKRVHGSLVVPGGVNKRLSPQERDYLLADIDRTVEWSAEAVAIARRLYEEGRARHNGFAAFPSPLLSLVRDDGALDLYHGGLRARGADGATLFDHEDYATYWELLHEVVKPWSYMKFPFLRALGPDAGWYRVGPLARLWNCDFVPTPRAEAERRALLDFEGGATRAATLAYHWARMIEMLHAAEGIRALLADPDLLQGELVVKGERRYRGVGVIEAPRGTLIHHYRINEDDQIVRCNLIVSTTHNNEAMNEAVRRVAERYLDGRELTEGLLNHIEVAIRAYDPCLSCATHALGQMPLAVELRDATGAAVDRLTRDADGGVRRG